MIYSSERNRTARSDNSSGRRPGNVVLVLIAVACTVTAVGVILATTGRFPSLGNRTGITPDDVAQLWEDQQYAEIAEITGRFLADDPLQPESLVFHGLATYYQLADNPDGRNDSEALFASIASLRRARVLSEVPHRRELEYTLGLAYFELGEEYNDLAVEHLENALELGAEGATIHEFLGLAYRDLGKLERSSEHFLKAAQTAPRDVLFLTIANVYIEKGRAEAAKEYLDRIITGSDEPSLVHEARLALGNIYLEEEHFEDAYRQFDVVLEENPNSADAHYHLGEYYYRQEDSVRARAHWRNAVNLDSGHLEALQRLGS